MKKAFQDTTGDFLWNHGLNARNEEIVTKFSYAYISKLATEQHEQRLKKEFPNILSISDAVQDMNLMESHVVAIYVSDDNIGDIPKTLTAQLPNDIVKTIPTDIITNCGIGKVQDNQQDCVNTKGKTFTGSFCCKAKQEGGKEYLVTAGHNYSNLYSTNYGGWLNEGDCTEVLLNLNKLIGKWSFQQLTNSIDIAFIELNGMFNNEHLIEFTGKGYYMVTDDTVYEEVTLISHKSGKRDGFILDHNTAWDVAYRDTNQLKNNIIMVGSTKNKNDSQTLSMSGDSGGLAIHKNTGKLLGIILGGNNKCTWILPIKETLEYFELKLT